MTELSTLDDAKFWAGVWESGDLTPLMHAGQKRMARAILDWMERSQASDVKPVDGSLPRVYAVKGGKRFGKTTGVIWIASMLAMRYPGCWMRYTSAFQKNIDEIIGVVTPTAFETAPPGSAPQYFGKRGPLPAGLYWPEYGPMRGARIALAGLDMNPNAMRGQANDFDFISEAGFVDKLIYTVKNVIYHQYQGRPHARCIIESSAPDHKGSDWEREILPDAEMRGACFEATIEDNSMLSRAEKDEFISAAGGRGSVDCEREYFNVIEIRAEEKVVPEFDPHIHVVDPALRPRPKHALAYVGLDPGGSDPFGLVWLYLDFLRQCIVVEAGWQKSNAPTDEVAAVIREIESELWGTGAKKPGTRGRELTIADAVKATPTDQVFEAPDDALTYWKENDWSLAPNPVSRVSDIDSRLIVDLNVMFALNVVKANKGPGSAFADTEYLRYLFKARPVKIEILKNGRTEMLIQQLSGGQWKTDDSGHRTDWLRSKALGHLDELAALKYVVRDINWSRDPAPPCLVDPSRIDVHMPTDMRQKAFDVVGAKRNQGRNFARPVRQNWR